MRDAKEYKKISNGQTLKVPNVETQPGHIEGPPEEASLSIEFRLDGMMTDISAGDFVQRKGYRSTDEKTIAEINANSQDISADAKDKPISKFAVSYVSTRTLLEKIEKLLDDQKPLQEAYNQYKQKKAGSAESQSAQVHTHDGSVELLKELEHRKKEIRKWSAVHKQLSTIEPKEIKPGTSKDTSRILFSLVYQWRQKDDFILVEAGTTTKTKEFGGHVVLITVEDYRKTEAFIVLDGLHKDPQRRSRPRW